MQAVRRSMVGRWMACSPFANVQPCRTDQPHDVAVGLLRKPPYTRLVDAHQLAIALLHIAVHQQVADVRRLCAQYEGRDRIGARNEGSNEMQFLLGAGHGATDRTKSLHSKDEAANRGAASIVSGYERVV